MIKDAGGTYVIVGHSERRQNHGEENADVNAKAGAAIRAGLTPIICVGETEAQRDRGETLTLVHMQVNQSIPEVATAENITIAYEPVWAIGTGRTPTLAEVAEVHGEIRKLLVKRFGPAGNAVRILYGGSVKPDNAKELMAVDNVNGALVGGASLKADDFFKIIQAF
jgi:triosephosphate isomerase